MANHGSREALHVHLDLLRDLLWIQNMDCRLYLVTVCLIFILASFHYCDAQGITAANHTINANDLDGLQSFQVAADGNGVLSQNWTGDNYCSWQPYVKCDRKTGRVTEVEVWSLGLNGTFPNNTLSKLTQLRYLDVANNTLSGHFPTDLKNLNLNHFKASDNQFSGPFPNLSLTSNLSSLDLSFNMLSGPIPHDLTGLTNLTSLNLSTNLFSGDVPLLPSNLGQLNMSDNNLTQVSQEDNSTFPNAFLRNPHLCVGNATHCDSVPPSVPAPVLTPESSNPLEGGGSGSKHLSTMSIIFIVLGVLLAVLVFIRYGRHFYLTRFGTPGGEFYHCYHPEDMEKSGEEKSPSPPTDKE